MIAKPVIVVMNLFLSAGICSYKIVSTVCDSLKLSSRVISFDGRVIVDECCQITCHILSSVYKEPFKCEFS